LQEAKLLPDYVKQISLPLSDWELENKIIPFRNAFFILIAAQRYSKIYLGATIGDTTKDKDYIFKGMMEGLLNYFGLDINKNGHSERPFEVCMPFKGMTKTKILETYLKAGGRMEDMMNNSRSCYQGGKKECGVCRSCLRKYVAFHNNFMDEFLNFQEMPNTIELNAFLRESIDKGRHPAEIEEIRKCINGR
jgi:7-cyano-7-deazaguanine synthase in queuosine biosynthesis